MRLTQVSLVVLVSLAFIPAAFSRLVPGSGKPAAGPLPTYCQMGECWILTVEATDPIAFGPKSVLFRVEGQKWHSTISTRNMKRDADSTSYVLCSKTTPAVIDEYEGRFLVTFLAPNDSGAYFHANETALATYFVVCHARGFTDLYAQGPVFAQSLGYAAKTRDDQPAIDAPEQVFGLLK